MVVVVVVAAAVVVVNQWDACVCVCVREEPRALVGLSAVQAFPHSSLSYPCVRACVRASVNWRVSGVFCQVDPAALAKANAAAAEAAAREKDVPPLPYVDGDNREVPLDSDDDVMQDVVNSSDIARTAVVRDHDDDDDDDSDDSVTLPTTDETVVNDIV